MCRFSRLMIRHLWRVPVFLAERSGSDISPLINPPSVVKDCAESMVKTVGINQRWFCSVRDEKEELRVVYKGRWMVPFYLLVRLKVLQLVGLGALVLPINTWLQKGVMDASVLFSSGLVVFGCGVASTTLWYFSKRYVGVLALKGLKKDTVRFSVMNFWGARTEEEYSLDSVIPPLRGLNPQEKADLLSKVLIPLDVIGGRQYFLSIKHGYIFDKQVLNDLLDGSLLRDTYLSDED